jgi:cytochrome c biogenesis protein CcmG/thiol:disulfide interchange protein DsbE
VVGGIAVVMVALFWVLLSADPNRTESADTPLIGRIAPASTGELADGAPFDLSRRKGSWVVLNFFTHNCVPCVREHPELIEFVDQQRALGTEGAEFYTIVRDSNRDEVEAFFAERGGDWPIVYDPRFEFANDFGVALVPETWIIDDNGVVRQRLISEVTAASLGSLIQQLRAQG